jgi:CubicO group peptidase (beta-lactamase class C family)
MPITAQSTVDPAFQPLHEQITEAMHRLNVPGVAVGILLDDQEHKAGFGVTNLDYPSPVLPHTIFQIGSITKTMTATLVMRLVESGALALDTPIRTYLPDLRLADEAVAAGVTLRHLLTHTGGWDGDFLLTLHTGRGDDALARFVERLPEAEQLTPLGTVWAYNNTGFSLAGRVIEVVTGKSYEAAATELLLTPLGLTDAVFFPEDAMLHSFAVGHNVGAKMPEVARPWPLQRHSGPAGGLPPPSATCCALPASRWAMGMRRTGRSTFQDPHSMRC